jgi:cobalt-zinc-cadmium efflux system protein
MILAQQCECPCENDIHQSQRKTRLLWIAIALMAGFFCAEYSVGFWSHSLSLQADAGHIFSDVAALGISLLANWLGQQPASGKATFGHSRVEILAALGNGLSLVAIATWVGWQAIDRFQSPDAILGLPMLVVAVLGLVINLLNIAFLHPHSHNDLNLKAVLLHVIADTLSSVGVIVAALVIHLWDWVWADAVVSLVVAGLTGMSAIPLLQESLRILLEYAPRTVNPSDVEIALKSFPGVAVIEKLNIWTVSSRKVVLCANLTVECTTAEERDRLLEKIQSHINYMFNITETTLQLTSKNSLVPAPLHPLFSSNLQSMLSGRQK